MEKTKDQPAASPEVAPAGPKTDAASLKGLGLSKGGVTLGPFKDGMQSKNIGRYVRYRFRVKCFQTYVATLCSKGVGKERLRQPIKRPSRACRRMTAFL